METGMWLLDYSGYLSEDLTWNTIIHVIGPIYFCLPNETGAGKRTFAIQANTK